jgi:allantoinase
MVKVNSAQGQCYVDMGFYGGVIPGNDQHLVPLHKAGVKGFKCFMIESGVDEFPCVDLEDITKAMEVLKVPPFLVSDLDHSHVFHVPCRNGPSA